MTLEISERAQKQLDRLDNKTSARIMNYLREVGNLENPRSRGKALTAGFAGLWRYRIGDYRAVCKIIDSELVIVAVSVGHRSEVYKG